VDLLLHQSLPTIVAKEAANAVEMICRGRPSGSQQACDDTSHHAERHFRGQACLPSGIRRMARGGNS
jgi:hypothetical protein